MRSEHAGPAGRTSRSEAQAPSGRPSGAGERSDREAP